jgi:hypothetical protein
MKSLIEHCYKFTLLLFLAFTACSEDQLEVIQEDHFLNWKLNA